MGLHREYERDWRANPEVQQEDYDKVFSMMTVVFRTANSDAMFSEQASVSTEMWGDVDARAHEVQRLAQEAAQAQGRPCDDKALWEANLKEEDDDGSE